MASSNMSDEKAELKTAVANGHPESLANAETADLAMLALEKRVLRKTDLVVLPMVVTTLPVLHLRWARLTITARYRCASFSSFSVSTTIVSLD